jgi:hypothetical protein
MKIFSIICGDLHFNFSLVSGVGKQNAIIPGFGGMMQSLFYTLIPCPIRSPPYVILRALLQKETGL